MYRSTAVHTGFSARVRYDNSIVPAACLPHHVVVLLLLLLLVLQFALFPSWTASGRRQALISRAGQTDNC